MIIINENGFYVTKFESETNDYYIGEHHILFYKKQNNVKITNVPIPKTIDKRCAVLKDGAWVEDPVVKERLKKMDEKRLEYENRK